MEEIEIKEIEVKEPKKIGRPKKTEYSFYDPHKQHIIKSIQQYPGQHVNRKIRYKIVYGGTEYKFSTLQQIMAEFEISCGLAQRLLLCFTKKSEGKELTKYEQKILDGYSKMTLFEKVDVNKKVKIIGFIKTNHTDTSLNLKVDIPNL